MLDRTECEIFAYDASVKKMGPGTKQHTKFFFGLWCIFLFLLFDFLDGTKEKDPRPILINVLSPLFCYRNSSIAPQNLVVVQVLISDHTSLVTGTMLISMEINGGPLDP